MNPAPTFRESDWQRPTIVQYFDARDDSIGRSAAQLADLDPMERATALALVSETVLIHTDHLDDHTLARFAVSVVDDLYRMLSTTEIWQPEADAYLTAAHGAYLAALRARGFRLRYIVENDYHDNLERVIQLYGRAFRSAGFAFVCPQLLARDLAIRAGAIGEEDTTTVADLDPWRTQAHRLAETLLLRRADEDGHHLAYLEADYEDGDLDAIIRAPTASGSILVFRNEAPLPGSKGAVRIT